VVDPGRCGPRRRHPLGATGKIDKKLIRQRMADCVLPTAAATAAAATVTKALAAPSGTEDLRAGDADSAPLAEPGLFLNPASAVEAELSSLPGPRPCPIEVESPTPPAPRRWLGRYLNFALVLALVRGDHAWGCGLGEGLERRADLAPTLPSLAQGSAPSAWSPLGPE